MMMTDTPRAPISREEREAAIRAQRRPAIIQAAMAAAVEIGFGKMVRRDIAKRAGVSRTLINHYFGDMDAVRDAVMAEAVRTEQLAIIAQGLVDGHAVAREAPEALRTAALAALA